MAGLPYSTGDLISVNLTKTKNCGYCLKTWWPICYCIRPRQLQDCRKLNTENHKSQKHCEFLRNSSRHIEKDMNSKDIILYLNVVEEVKFLNFSFIFQFFYFL